MLKTRIAPTPSGFIHEGNAVNFILNAVVAKATPGGRLLLRIDDMDADRKRPEYVDDIFRVLDWLGIEWDEGPSGPDDFEQYWSQHHRLALYEAFLEDLKKKDLVFPCQISRKTLSEYGQIYPEQFKNQAIALDTPDTAWRAKTPADLPLSCFVVRRRDGLPAYQVVSICDDVHFKITQVFRGEDLVHSSAAQQWLAQAAGNTAFGQIKIQHHPLIADKDGLKLSKSAGAASVRHLGPEKHIKSSLLQISAKWLGCSHENIQNLPDLVALFKQND